MERQSDGITVVDLNRESASDGQFVHQVIVPIKGDELHHFGWNACSSSLAPLSGHAFLERRYLIAPGSLDDRFLYVACSELSRCTSMMLAIR